MRIGRHDRTPTGRLPRGIFSLLVSRLGNAITFDTLIDAVWGEFPPKSVRSALQVHVSKIRQALGVPDLLVTTDHGYRLQADPQSVDVYRFELGVGEGRRLFEAGAYSEAAGRLRSALAEWRGEPYGDIHDGPAVQSEVTRLLILKREGTVALASAQLETSGTNPDLTAFEALVQSDPLDERGWAMLMTALYRSGRQAEALRTFHRASHLLAEELGIEPSPDLRHLEERILLQDPALMPTTRSPQIVLPGFATSLVGRVDQITTLAKRVAEYRLVTVTGLGGVGKTRMAVAAAHAAIGDTPDGIVFVPLDPVTEDVFVVDAVITALGVEPSPRDPTRALVDHVGGRRLLLVLDNCEQVLEGVRSLVGRLISECPEVRILCTSRIPIDMIGETLVPLAPLAVPADGTDLAEPVELLQSEAVMLFCDRARLARPGFTIDSDNGPVVAGIVRELAGIPLAIEIAAAKTDVLTPTDILRRIEKDAGSLVGEEFDRPGRHHSMRAALAWSLDLLDGPSRLVFERLAVFQSPVDADTVEAVCQDAMLSGGAIHGALAALVRSSMLTVHLDAAQAHYSYLPPVRRAALDRLGVHEPMMRRRHLDHYAALVAEEAVHAGGPDETASFARITAMLDELRSALHHAAAHGPEIGRRMCVDLGTYWVRSGHSKEGRSWVGQFLEADGDGPPDVNAGLWHVAGSLALVEEDLEAAENALREALRLRRQLGSNRDLGMTLSNLGSLANSRGEYERAEVLLCEAHDVFAAADFGRGQAATRLNLGIVLINLGRLDEAIGAFDEAIGAFRLIGDRSEEAHALARLGFALGEAGDLSRAEACRVAAHEIAESLGRRPEIAFSHMGMASHYLDTGAIDRARSHVASAARLIRDDALERWWVPNLLELAAGVAADTGDLAMGARLLGCASTERDRRSVPVPESNTAYHTRISERIEAGLGPHGYLVEFEVGRTLALDRGLAAVAGWS